MTRVECPFRTNVRLQSSGEVATCELLKQVTGLPDSLCTVRRDACAACLATRVQEAIFHNPVLPSLIHQACDWYLSESPSDGVNNERVRSLREQSLRAILDREAVLWRDDQVAASDVVVCCHDGEWMTRAAIDSVLAQEAAIPIVHLVDLGGAAKLVAEYRTKWNVRIHPAQLGASPLLAAHKLIDAFETPFVAIQTTNSVSYPWRLAGSVGALMAQGADLYASPADVPGGVRQAVAPSAAVFQRCVPVDTLVFRRATFVDMGGVADRQDDDAEFVYRAACERRNIVVGQESMVRLLEDSTEASLGPPPEYRSDVDDSFRHVARGFPKQSVACDVVLPFHGFLDFTREAIESVLSQDNADVVVHLVDDASPGNTDAFLNYWKSHSQVRVYRNLRNLGQFTSFNNVSQFFETDLAAVQDADDVSLPCRISHGGALLRLSGAEFFGAAVQLFCNGDGFDTVAGGTSSPESASDRPVRRSFYPAKNSEQYFLENPTAMLRVAMFRRQGGYGDFGDPLANRASLDTEFLLRCLYSGVEFAISRQVVSRYRVHQGSATHNNQTGWGTPARRRSGDQVAYRSRIYRNTRRFDPRLFGAIGRYQHLTCRVGGG